MATGATPILALPYPVPADPNNVPADVQSLATAVEDLHTPQGLLANRPSGAAGKRGQTYYSTDKDWWSRHDGTVWHDYQSKADADAAYEPKGSSGLVKIAETILGADAATVTFASIPQTYRSLLLVCATQQADTASRFLTVRFNGDTTANYDYQVLNGIGTAASASETFGAAYGMAGVSSPTGAGKPSSSSITIPDYARTTWDKQFMAVSAAKVGVASGNLRVTTSAGFWRNTAAITQIDLSAEGGAFNLKAGSVFTLYGLST